MQDFTLYGGYSYSLPDAPEQFDNVRAACEAWLDRYHSNGIIKVDGVLWPTWGDMADDDYAIVQEGDGLTKSEVIHYDITSELPFGWEQPEPVLDQDDPGPWEFLADPNGGGEWVLAEPDPVDEWPSTPAYTENRQYVMVVNVDETLLDGDESIENVARFLNEVLGNPMIQVQPLSEVISA